MRVLSLCSGIMGLDLHHLNQVTHVAETDTYPSVVLAERFPFLDNLGDWTHLDNFDNWDVISGGLPCQPVSQSGKNKGDKDDRYLYDELIRILRRSDLRPDLMLENVRGILFPRHSALYWRLVNSLADMGYVGRFGLVRASDTGAPHKRERWFAIATHRERMGWGTRPGPRQSEPSPVGGYGFGDDDRAFTAVTHSIGRQGFAPGHGTERSLEIRPRSDVTRRVVDSGRFGEFSPAIRRWEAIIGRPAPIPTDDAKRLSAVFVEWLMGFPQGYVSGLDIPRTHVLRMLGNSVVPQQAELAFSLLQGDNG